MTGRRVGKGALFARRAHRGRDLSALGCCGGHASLCPPYDADEVTPA